MTEEKLNKGGELIKHIKRLIEQKEKWEEANAIHRIELSTTTTYCGQSKYVDVDNSFVNFEDIKLLALARIQKRIDQLQKEFDALWKRKQLKFHKSFIQTSFLNLWSIMPTGLRPQMGMEDGLLNIGEWMSMDGLSQKS